MTRIARLEWRRLRGWALAGAALVLGLIYSLLPGVSMIGHIVGLIIGTTMGFVIPLKVPKPTVAAGQFAVRA